ncbi:P-loop containing nucleoside triphosphate hydrolase protein [Xylariaceae sp. AK1471]|nr:P-loop containing nucleoside triphosphate hydrolase protein [Xylariaceae sp. AK1471]
MSGLGPVLPMRSKQATISYHNNSQGFRDGHVPRPTDVFIAVMGVTGSGKSSFISACSEKRVTIGHDLNACTSTVDVYPYELSSSCTVYLIDTPGFDDTNRSDTEVLDAIATWLGDSYKNKILLHGIVYLHRISDVRMQGSAKRNLLTFKELCGEKALVKVILATTMWDKVSEEEGSRRENELRKGRNFGDGCCQRGAPVTDLMLVDEQRTLGQTSAGRELLSELIKEREKWEKEREDIKKQMEEAIKKSDREAQEALQEERDRYTRMIKKAEKNTDALRSTMEDLIARRDEKVAHIERRMKEQQASYEKELKRLKSEQTRIEQDKAKLERKAHRKQKHQPRGKQTSKSKSTPKKSITPFSLYSVTKYENGYILSSPKAYKKSQDYPPSQLRSKRIDAASIGDNGAWVARYEGGNWYWSENLTRNYPYLAAHIDFHGIETLETCFLGPGQRHFARWQDGRYCCEANESTKRKIKECYRKIVAVAFGYADSCVVSYGTDLTKLSNHQDLGRYYPTLQQFLNQNKELSHSTLEVQLIILWFTLSRMEMGVIMLYGIVHQDMPPDAYLADKACWGSAAEEAAKKG